MASELRRNVRIAAWGLAMAAAGLLAWAVAPAISLGTYVPEPVNFEQAVPPVEEVAGRAALGRRAGPAGEGPVRYVSEPFAAPKRFDLVGLTERDERVELRARSTGGAWTRWVETSGGEPVWTGGSDELQLRSRDGRPEGEIAYVNVSGDATPADRAITTARTAANSAFGTVAALFVGEPANGDAPFEVVNRNEWDPGHDCVPRDPVYGKVKAGVVHHTVNANDYTADEAPGIVLAICRFHRYSHGWNDIGYNALVDRFGNVYAGRTGGLTNAVIGAHSGGFNSQTFGVSSIGDHSDDGMSRPAINAVTNLLAWKLSLHGIDAVGRTRLVAAAGSDKYRDGARIRVKEITRHRKLSMTSCPGRAQVTRILKKTRAKIASGTYDAPPAPPPEGGGGVPVLPQR
jgi:hypothetical protein